MTSTHKLLPVIVTVILLFGIRVYAQTLDSELNHFEADGFSFDYPRGFSLKDESTTEAQQLTITRKGSSVRLRIIAVRDMIFRDQLSAAVERFKEPAIKKTALTLGQATEQTAFQTQVGGKQAEGVRLRSTGKRIVTGEVIWLRLHFRLVGFEYLRSTEDEALGSVLWKTVSSSLRLDVVIVGTKAAEPNDNTRVEGGVMNGKAIALPQPAYPPIARAAHASGTVIVQVLIDEQGNVIDAHAVEGHPLLQAVSVAAARAAKFSPTLLEDEPVRVTGVIRYNFIAQ